VSVLTLKSVAEEFGKRTNKIGITSDRDLLHRLPNQALKTLVGMLMLLVYVRLTVLGIEPIKSDRHI